MSTDNEYKTRINDVPQIKNLEGDIVNFAADAMVLSANRNMDYPVGQGLDEKVYDRAGKEELIAERKRVLQEQGITRLKARDVFVTSAGKMTERKRFKYIIHVIVPQYRRKYIEGKIDHNLLFLGTVIEKILFKAKEYGIKSLSMPLIGSGGLGFRHSDVRNIIKASFKKVLETDMEYFKDFVLYVVEKEEKYKKNFKDFPEREELLRMLDDPENIPDFQIMDEECLKRWVNQKEAAIRELREHGLFERNITVSDIKRYLVEGSIYRNHNSTKKTRSLPKNRWLDLLDKYQKRNNINDAELLRLANIIKKDKTKLTKMRNGQKSLGREFIVRFAMALKLTMDEAKEFICLGSGGIEFPDTCNDWEMTVYDCIENKIYDVAMLDEEINRSLEYPDAERGMNIDNTKDDRDNDI